jgi:hypothetical protein
MPREFLNIRIYVTQYCDILGLVPRERELKATASAGQVQIDEDGAELGRENLKLTSDYSQIGLVS